MTITGYDITIYCVGYGVSLLLGHITIYPIIKHLWRVNQPSEKEAVTLSQAVGVIERFLYTTAILIGEPTLIAVWLVFKVAPQWGRWRQFDKGRRIYNIFLIGSGLSLIFGIIGGFLIKWLQNHQ